MPCQMTGSPEVVYRQIAGVNRTTRTQSVQDRIISETHSSLLQRGGRGKGAAAPFPFTPLPRRTSSPSLRTTSPGPSRLTKPNTSCTIITPASLRSDCCSSSLRNAVRLASGIDVHLHRNTHKLSELYPQAEGGAKTKGRARVPCADNAHRERPGLSFAPLRSAGRTADAAL